MSMSRTFLIGSAVALFGAVSATAETATIGVASNFAEAARALASDFREETGHQIRISIGSTGSLFTQIVMGAPYDIFMAADQTRPESIEQYNLGVEGTRFTYAVGYLTLWSSEPDTFTDGLEALQNAEFDHLAMANPDVAPYGVAAREVLEHYGLWEGLQDKIVIGENIGQVYVMVDSFSAELGFVAASNVISADNDYGVAWDVPGESYTPIRQDAILLKTAENNEAALAFIEYLQSDSAAPIMRFYGYGVAE